MPKDINYRHRMIDRTSRRNRFHPDWRQIAYDQGFVCTNAADEAWWEVCEVTYNLEYHEPFGENRPKDEDSPKMQSRILMCRACHQQQASFFPYEFGRVSMLLEDIDCEIRKLGSLNKWIEHYGIKKEARP
ncbi:hypothetical protein LCGC14_0897460 [marine sediment metagenome]|uniref:Uncharacterized protein n=1 Tax=marine sediment metagenome TaxID=412755 RepID=A0A0F9NXD9_9ZZZZ